MAKPGTPKLPPDGPLSASSIRTKWDESQRASVKERQAFWINSAFLGNEQWVRWDEHNGQLVEADRDGDRLRLTENVLWPSSRTNIAKLLRRPLVFEVPPASADDAAVEGSRTSQAVLSHVHREHDWEDLRRRNAWLTWKGAISVLCVEWDPKAGVPLGATDEGDDYGTGDTCESVLSVTEVATEMGAKNLERARWWIKAQALPPKQVKEMYNLEQEPAPDATGTLSPLQRRLMSGMNTGPATVPLTLVLTYFERPGPDNKKGAVAVIVGEQVVEQGKWPFPFTDKLNCVAVRETAHDYDWLADTILSAAISPQFALNHAVSKIGEHMKWAADARLGVPDGAGDEWDELSDMPEVVRYSPQAGAAPAWIVPPSMPQWWVTAPDRFKAAIDDILGVHDVSRGETPTNVHSGVAIGLLAEQDDTPLGLLSREMAEAWGAFASLVLEILEDKVKETRKARVGRQGEAPQKVEWTGKDLHGQTTAVVPLDAVAPRSQAAQMELAFRVQAAFAGSASPLDLKTFARIAQLPDASDLVEAVDMDEVKARRENAEMSAGNLCEVAEFDAHATHLKILNDFRKSTEYEALPGVRVIDADHLQQLMPELLADPSQIGPKTYVDIHALGHEVDAAREMGAQLARAQVSPAFAGAAQANEPPLAGDHAAIMANMPGSATAPLPPGNPSNAPALPSGPMEGPDGQPAAPQPGQ